MKLEIKCNVCGSFLDDVEDYFNVKDEYGLEYRSGEYYVPMYEGEIVNPNTHEWAGFQSCKKCADKSIVEASK